MRFWKRDFEGGGGRRVALWNVIVGQEFEEVGKFVEAALQPCELFSEVTTTRTESTTISSISFTSSHSL
jgi:hypothetical protein